MKKDMKTPPNHGCFPYSDSGGHPERARPLRVLHVIPSISSIHGGPTRAMHHILSAMSSTGVTIDLATSDDDGSGRRLSIPATELLIAPTKVFVFRKLLEFYKFAPGFIFWFWRCARDYDVVHVHALFSFLSVAAAVIARFHGVPYVVRPLGTLSTYGVARRRPKLKLLSLSLIEGPILRHAAAVHFTSDAEMREAEALSVIIRSVVIPLAVEMPSRLHIGKPATTASLISHPFEILYLSRLDPKKNVEGLLRGIQLVRAKLPAIRLVIAGDGDPHYVASLKQLADDVHVSDAIEWVGFVEGAAKTALLSYASIYVLTSFSENFGIAVAEALAAGLPCVVTSGVAISADIAEYAAGIVVPPVPEAIAEAIVSLLGDATARQTASRNASRLAAERFSTEAMRTKLFDLYHNIAKRGDAIAASSAVA